MINLNFDILEAEPVNYALSPTLAFKLVITQSPPPPQTPVPIHNIALHCQIRLEPARRRYSQNETRRLFELFGQPRQWGQTMRSMLWTQVDLPVGGFTDRTTATLAVPCTYDFNIATTKYFDALEDGLIPLCFLFSGTIFYAGSEGSMRMDRISWDKEADFPFPRQTWMRMMNLHYSDAAWLCMRKDLFDRLRQYQLDHALPTWEQAIENLLSPPQPNQTS